MRKILSLLLGVLMIIGVTAFTGVALAQNQEGSYHSAVALDSSEFVQMTPSEQYEYLMTLGSEEEIEQALSLLSSEQLAALEEYRQSVAAQNPEPSESETSEGSEQTAEASEELPAAVDDAAGSSGIDYSTMTPQALYEYLFTLETDEEIDAVISALTPEQYAALQAYALSVAEAKQQEEPNLAANYTSAAAFKDPVYVLVPMMTRQFAAQALTVLEEDEKDALVLGKTVSGSDGSYLLTIDAYATGEVSITTGQTPVPADIILVLDISLSMDGNMISGYAPITFTKNSTALDFYDDNDLFVKVGDQYYQVTIIKSGSNYTYSYTGSGGQVTAYSSGNNSQPPSGWSFYQYSTTTRIAALQAAANSFIDSIEAKANSGAGVDHRIAAVSYSTAASIISGSSASDAFVSAHNNTSGINTLQGAINGLDTVMYTRADLGLQKAVDIFQHDYPDSSGPRNRVVVFFTDGAPASSGDGSFQLSVANPAISNAKTLKASTSASPAGCGAMVYSIGIFDGANPTTPISSASNENKFMHLVSTNYPTAVDMSPPYTGSNAGFYLSASNTAGLNSIFQSISENIETGGTTVTLDETSVIKDMIAPYFQLPAGAVASDIHLYTSAVNTTTGAWLPRQPFSGTVTISADRKTIGVSGFDYHDNYYAAIETNGEVTGYQGTKLIIEIPIQYIDGSCFGGTVPTNKPVSGVYDGDFMVEALPIPMVDIPVHYDFTPIDQPIYLTQDAMINGFFTTAAGYVADGVNNAYVNIVYTVKTAGGTVLGTYTIPAGQTTGTWDISTFALEGLTANIAYTVSCTVTPVGVPIDPSKVYPITVSKTATVYVWKPEVTWCDSVIYLGETADYSDNYVSVVWKNSIASAPAPAGVAPTLQYQFAPVEAVFTEDTHVTTTVKVGSDNITAYTHFVHETCSFPGCGFNPALGQFMVHIKTCSLTITKTGAADPTDTFIFTVTGGGLTLQVSVQGNCSTMITGLPVGDYTVKENAAWSWRYTAADAQATLNAAHATTGVTMSNVQTDDQWLSGDSHAVNTFPDAG